MHTPSVTQRNVWTMNAKLWDGIVWIVAWVDWWKWCRSNRWGLNGALCQRLARNEVVYLLLGTHTHTLLCTHTNALIWPWTQNQFIGMQYNWAYIKNHSILGRDVVHGTCRCSETKHDWLIASYGGTPGTNHRQGCQSRDFWRTQICPSFYVVV